MKAIHNHKLIKYLQLTLLCFLISGCIYDDFNNILSVENKSNRIISVLYTNHEKSELTENNVAAYISDWQTIHPDSIRNITVPFNKSAWQEYIQKGKQKKLFIYVFEVDTLKKYDGVYSMNELRSRHKYLRLLDFTEQQLIKNNWKITFK